MAEPTAIVPDKGIRGCYNDGVDTLVLGLSVKLSTIGDERLQVEPAGAGEGVYGIVAETKGIESQTWGDIQVEGIARGLSGAAVTKGAAVAADADGKLVAAGSGALVVGVAVTAALGVDSIFEVELSGTGGGYVAP